MTEQKYIFTVPDVLPKSKTWLVKYDGQTVTLDPSGDIVYWGNGKSSSIRINDVPKEWLILVYPCADCGMLRTGAQGGTTFTVRDDCWDKAHPKEPGFKCKECGEEIIRPHYDCELKSLIRKKEQEEQKPVSTEGDLHKRAINWFGEHAHKFPVRRGAVVEAFKAASEWGIKEGRRREKLGLKD